MEVFLGKTILKCKQCNCHVLEVYDPIAGNYLVCSNQSCQFIHQEEKMNNTCNDCQKQFHSHYLDKDFKCPECMYKLVKYMEEKNKVGRKDKEVISAGGTQFETGAVRSADASGVMYQLISPIGMRRLAETMKEGFDKYGTYNWERGMPIGDILNHGLRHIFEYLSGDRSEDHLAHATWNLMAAMHMEETHPHLEHGLRPSSSPEKVPEIYEGASIGKVPDTMESRDPNWNKVYR